MNLFYINVAASSSVLIPIIIAVLRRRYWRPPQYVIFIYLLVAVVFGLIANITAYSGINNMPFLHLYTILEVQLILAFYKRILKARLVKHIITIAQIALPIFAVIDVLVRNSLYEFNTPSRVVCAVSIILLSLFYLIVFFNQNKALKFGFNFKIATGLLLYFSGVQGLFLVSNMAVENRLFFELTWTLHSVYLIILYLFIAYAFYKLKPKV